MTLDDGTVEAVRRIAASDNLLVALDFDGTLAPLEDEPMRARALPESTAAIDRLTSLPDTTVAYVSGRQLADLVVISEHSDDSLVHLAGSHGAEFWHPPAAGISPRPRVDDVAERARADALVDAARDLVAGIPGAWIEPKAFGFGLHTRLANDAGTIAATDAIDELVATRAPNWRRRTGRDILEYAWRHEGKDSAVEALRELSGATAVLFAGDDVTDEDALASLGPDDLGVRVGEGPTAATVRLGDAAALAALLDLLGTLRADLSQ
ncbi:MAG TPA: trehalose-phosphatase [Microbacterium sp.]|uniref:trehalose-phosphatase n=1 Tax=Microbacterium sp. TaxID=51671 RepID=UPI002CD581D4|nr:trehalose-phosphatase [Microbacterium sp.]HWI30959.1 trehalose-phosphatase [Microbacterium sp.]